MSSDVATLADPLSEGWQEHIESSFQVEDGSFHTGLPTEPAAELQTGVSVVICTYKRAASLGRLLHSLAGQTRKPDQLIVVDASPDAATEQVVREHSRTNALAGEVRYFRVAGPLKGLTRQRNFGLRWVETDLMVFFDDDVVLAQDCLGEMERVHREGGGAVAGVGAYVENGYSPPTLLWRVRRWLGIVPDLTPGRYHRSGMSVPWSFLPPTMEAVEGEWLIGCSMMWPTAAAREVGFCSHFDGYAQAEDLDFSLRMRRKGKLLMVGSARLQHFHEASGRPDFFKLGYMAIYNRYVLHEAGLENRTWRDVAWFTYSWGIDTVMLARRLFRPTWTWKTLQEYAGRTKAVVDLLRRRRRAA